MHRSELAKYFKDNLFVASLQAAKKEVAIAELLDTFVREKYIRNRDIVLEMLHQRETLGSTGIGKGVAIPHGRTTAAADVLIAFGKSDQGIDFDAIDGKPVHLFFMVIAPPNEEGNVYLPILGSLVTILNEKANRDKLMKVETFQDFIAIITGE
ncbi:MAG: PTS system fructose-specific EIIABC component [bacterium ADurb.Bin431]|nr:MAG: PTS system fructose-specific EIIABC component [bacterium ADurb.Bin431]HNY91482.1 PTS sugar transporter subunit IIA [bacterium]HOC25485.1 PTS sugar transporter subunit IIA [bacterium]HOH07220.1 PTS sugar transporter subunit IIA [bacterium]HOY44128.1 PTS sugar transporter subunit IIA [bacterium]